MCEKNTKNLKILLFLYHQFKIKNWPSATQTRAQMVPIIHTKANITFLVWPPFTYCFLSWFFVFIAITEIRHLWNFQLSYYHGSTEIQPLQRKSYWSIGRRLLKCAIIYTKLFYQQRQQSINSLNPPANCNVTRWRWPTSVRVIRAILKDTQS